MPLLETEKLSVRFGGLAAIRDLSLTIEEREIFAVIGPNGAGKTTFFNAITGVTPPSTGKVKVNGKEICAPLSSRNVCIFIVCAIFGAICAPLAYNLEFLWEHAISNLYTYQQPFPWGKAASELLSTLQSLPGSATWVPFFFGGIVALLAAHKQWSRTRISPDGVAHLGITRTFQNICLCNDLPLVDNIMVGMQSSHSTSFWPALFGIPSVRRAELQMRLTALELLKFVGITAPCETLAGALPYGHQRRLEIARALACNPKLLLLDEPAAGMNPTESEQMITLIRKIRELGITVLLIEHDMRVVMGISDRIAVLDHGELIALGTVPEVQKNPRVIEAYLGSSPL